MNNEEKETIIDLIKQDPSNYTFINEEFKKDKEIIKHAIKGDEEILQNKVPRSILEERSFILELVKVNGLCWRFIPQEYKSDKEIQLEAISSEPQIFNSVEFRNLFQMERNSFKTLLHRDGSLLELTDDKIKSDKELVWIAVNSNKSSFEYASDELKNNKDFMLKIVEIFPFGLKFASKDIKNNKEIVGKAVEKNGFLLQEASPELQSDKEIVLKAVKNRGESIKFADSKFVNDYDVMCETVKTFGQIYTSLHISLRKKEEILYPAVYDCPNILTNYLLSPYLDDREVFLRAVQRDGNSIRLASLRIQNDKEIVIKAIQHGLWFDFVTNEMKNDKEIAIEAVKRSEFAFRKLPNQFQSDFEFILSLVKTNDMVYNELSEEFQSNKEITIAALMNKSKLENIDLYKMRGFRKIIQDQEVYWFFKKYFKFIRDVKSTFNIHFSFK
jgi:hypothetical protein